MKNLILMLLTAALCLAGLVFAENADSDWYMAVLTDEARMADYPYYRFVDVNGDGVPVLFITTTENAFITAEDRGLLFTCVDGKATQTMAFGESAGERFYCNADEHTLTYYYRFSGESHIEVYNVVDGALALLTQADSWQPGHGPVGDNTEPVCMQDGETITGEAYDALCALYANEADEVTYELWQTEEA